MGAKGPSATPPPNDSVATLKAEMAEAKRMAEQPGMAQPQALMLVGFADGIEHTLRSLAHIT